MPFIARLAAAAVKVLGFASRVGPSVAPTSLSASAVSGVQVNLSWTNTSSLYPIYVYRGTTSGGPYTFTQSVSATGTSASVTSGITGNTTYYFVVAYFFVVVGPYSNQATATTPACAANGTINNYSCTGCDYYAIYNNGSCGFYSGLIEANSNSCGCGAQNLRGAVDSGESAGSGGSALGYLYGNDYGGTNSSAYCSPYSYVTVTMGPLSGTSYYGTVGGGICYYGNMALSAGTKGSYTNSFSTYIGFFNSCGYTAYNYGFYYFP